MILLFVLKRDGIDLSDLLSLCVFIRRLSSAILFCLRFFVLTDLRYQSRDVLPSGRNCTGRFNLPFDFRRTDRSVTRFFSIILTARKALLLPRYLPTVDFVDEHSLEKVGYTLLAIVQVGRG